MSDWTEDTAQCGDCGVELELVKPGKFQHPDCDRCTCYRNNGMCLEHPER